jgi:RNA polymerase sigma-70 factor (ECF subfamily)
MATFSGTLCAESAITHRMPIVKEPLAALDPDAALIRRTTSGDRDAFALLYRRHQGSVYRFARLMTGSTSAAEDVVQEVFLTLMKDAARYDPARATLSTYLFGIARRLARRRLLRDGRFVALDSATTLDQPTPDAAVSIERERELSRLRKAIVSLPSRYREVVILCDLEGVTYENAALSIGCAVGTVRSRLHRARHLLARKMRCDERRNATSRPIMRCAI